ncbi:MAG: aspartate carbamoyltransferase regulatory subunit [Chlamydiales bacterium]
MKEFLSVAAIEYGTVIDHIPAKTGLRIAHLLKLASYRHQVTLGLNLPSKTMGYKDLLKVEGREVSESEASQIAIFAPKATINIIQNFELVKKFSVTLPEKIEGILHCSNEHCVTNHQEILTRFKVSVSSHLISLKCYYCDKHFAYDTF